MTTKATPSTDQAAQMAAAEREVARLATGLAKWQAEYDKALAMLEALQK